MILKMMKRTILILLAAVLLAPVGLLAQDAKSLYTGWAAGLQLGIGGMIPTGSLGDNLKACAVFNAGATFEYNRFRLKIDANYSQPSFKNENPYDVRDELGRNLQRNATASTTSLGVGFTLGYTVWRQGKVSVTPNVGMNINRLSWEMNSIKWSEDEQGEIRPQIDNVTDVHENSNGFTASVDIDILLGGKFVDVGGNSHYTSSVRVTPFITHAGYGNWSPAVKGNWIGMTVSYAGLFHLLQR